jgi:tetratricopeptide (TPR) repeat protein
VHPRAGRVRPSTLALAWLLSWGPLGAGCVSQAAARGRRALDEHAFSRASQAFEQAVRDAPDELSYWVDLGRAYVGEGRAPDAVRAFEHACALAPTQARLAVYLGHAQELARRYDLAERAYRRAIALAPDRAWPYRVLGTRLLRWGRAAEARVPLEQASQRDPTHAETQHALAIALAQSGDPAGAERVLRAAVARFPRQRSLRLGLAALVVNRAGYAEALAIYGDVLTQAPDFAPAYVGRALLLAQLGRREEAEQELDRAVLLDPRNGVYRERLRTAGSRAP